MRNWFANEDVLYAGMTDWIINAFNGEWIRLRHPKPKVETKRKRAMDVAVVV